MPGGKPLILLLRPHPAEPGPLADVGIVAVMPAAVLEPNEDAVRSVANHLRECDWLVLTSPRAPPLLAGIADEVRRAVDQGLRVACVGPRTAEAVKASLGVAPHLVPGEYRGLSLAVELLRFKPSCVLLARSERGVRELPETLKAAGIRVVEVKLYRLRLLEDVLQAASRIVGYFDYLIVTSPSVAEALAARLTEAPRGAVVAIGPSTAKALERHGVKALVPDEYTLDGVARLVSSDWASRRAGR